MPIKSAALRKNGVVYTGLRHNEIFRQRPFGELYDAEQGFVTDEGLFVTREQALAIANECGQIKKKHPPYNKLMSEDIL